MQFRILPALVVFVGSYLPLSLILLAQNFDYAALRTPLCWPLTADQCDLPFRNPAFAIGIFVIALLCFAATVVTLRLIEPLQDIMVLEAKYVPSDLMNYTLPYIVSFMSIDYQDTGKFIGFVVFLGWMFWISLRSGQVILNPVLIALGWRLYETTYRFAASQDKHIGRALVKGDLSPGATKQWPIQDIQIIKQRK